jgi:proteasome beta subunit
VTFFKGMDPGSSFFDLLAATHPQLRPHRPAAAQPEVAPRLSPSEPGSWAAVPHGTTVLAVKYAGGGVIAGDRRATEGYQIASRNIEKVYRADDYSAIAIAGAAGPCIEMARLFQTELEHYEKLEGTRLTTEGKANKLSQMVKSNLPLAMQGLIVIPIFIGYDASKGEGRIFKFDVTGGRYEETDYYATGSGGKDARNTIKNLYKPSLNETEAIALAVQALVDAADEDAGTGGPDPQRGIYPSVKTVTAGGINDVEPSVIKGVYENLLKKRGKGA